ncbi:terpene synthase family protein [Chitinophaga sp. 22536]|uniref:terpene synthase family protein n=1 Tax=unclassified Chitinophaga TaxID=2619133 RepID=UPI003F83BA07
MAVGGNMNTSGLAKDLTTQPTWRNAAILELPHLATNSLQVTADVDFSAITDNAVVQQLNISAQILICVANDLFSLGKEAGHSHGGALFNIVNILASEKNISTEVAIQLAAEVHDNRMMQFVELTNATPKNPNIQRYIDGLGALWAGNILWSTRYSTRYPHHYLG